MSPGILTLILAQASAAPAEAQASSSHATAPVAVSVRASARILAPTAFDFRDLGQVKRARPQSVQITRTSGGTTLVEFS